MEPCLKSHFRRQKWHQNWLLEGHYSWDSKPTPNGFKLNHSGPGLTPRGPQLTHGIQKLSPRGPYLTPRGIASKLNSIHLPLRAKMTPRVPKWAPRSPKSVPRDSKSTPKNPKSTPRDKNKWHLEAENSTPRGQEPTPICFFFQPWKTPPLWAKFDQKFQELLFLGVCPIIFFAVYPLLTTWTHFTSG